MLTRLGIVVLALILVACQPEPQDKEQKKIQDRLNQSVIYGDDDRINVYEILDPNWHTVAASTVALVSNFKVVKKSNHYFIEGDKIGEIRNFCEDEPFYDEPFSAFCSGSLIGKDIVVTAGHCIRNQYDCDDTKLVFNFAYKNSANDDPQTVSEDDVYSCKEIIHSEVVGWRGSDFALIRLDREVVGHTPLKAREDGIIGDTEALTVIGHPSGLPTKYAGGANVRDNLHADYFVANLDTYGGNSGSAVFNKSTGEIEGILVRGETDYIHDGYCVRSNKCEDDGCRGEDVTRITKIWDHVTVDDLNSGAEAPTTDVNPVLPSEEPEAVPPAPVDRSGTRTACERTLGNLSGLCSLL